MAKKSGEAGGEAGDRKTLVCGMWSKLLMRGLHRDYIGSLLKG